MPNAFIDIHCHMLPGIDDGPAGWEESLAMARMAVADGITAIVATPHQRGPFAHNRVSTILERVALFQQMLDQERIPLDVLPGADVRIDTRLASLIRTREVLTLSDAGHHILLELPHDMYFPLEPVLDELERIGVCGILTHPERNAGIARSPRILERLVDYGCLMQITAGSLSGVFGKAARDLAEWMLRQSLVHFIATDAHGTTTRRPMMRRAYDHVVRLLGQQTADLLCRENPERALEGLTVRKGRVQSTRWRILTGWTGRRAG